MFTVIAFQKYSTKQQQRELSSLSSSLWRNWDFHHTGLQPLGSHACSVYCLSLRETESCLHLVTLSSLAEPGFTGVCPGLRIPNERKAFALRPLKIFADWQTSKSERWLWLWTWLNTYVNGVPSSYIPPLAFPSLVSSVWLLLGPHNSCLSRAEPQITSKNKLYQLEIIPLPKLPTVLTLCGMFLAARFFEMCFLKYNNQNGFESKERESQLVVTTWACVLKL